MSLNVAARALTTNQAVLQTIGHNIANANTVGYSRQTTDLQQVPGQQFGNGYMGKGVEVASVKRSYDAFLTRQANATQTVAAADAVRHQKMQQVESLFPLGEGSLGSMLNSALNAWVDVNASPADSTARGVVISRSDELAARIRDTSARLDELGTTAQLQSAEVIKSINLMAQQIASLNDRIARTQSSNAVPNDLMDQRDQLLADLGKKVQIHTIGAGDGTITVFVAGSLPLVLGNKAAALSPDRDPLDGEYRQAVSFVQGNNRFEILDEHLVGGELKGLQDFVNKDLAQTRAQLGRMALAVASELNAQHQSGLKTDGTPGGLLFDVGTLSGKPATTNATPVALPLEVVDGTALAASDYQVTYTSATSVGIQRLSDGRFFNPALYNPTGTPPNDGFQATATTVPLGAGAAVEFDGLRLTGQPGTQTGDRFVLRPGAEAARALAVAISAPAELAVASRLGVAPAPANSGTSAIEGVSVSLVRGSMPASPTPVPGFTLTFDAATRTMSVSAPAAPATVSAVGVAYTPGRPMSFTLSDGSGPPANQWSYQLTLRGEPANGDQFVLSQTPPTGLSFNAGNAQAMLALRDQTTFDGNTTLADGYVSVFSGVASRLGEVRFSAQFSQTQAASAEMQRANQAGVNLDEEAAKLIQFQQAYQASAKYMGTVQSLFDTLMSTFR